MASEKQVKGPTFLRYVDPIVETLKELGSSGTSSEVSDRVIERLRLSEAEQAATTSTGQSRVRNQIHWAKFYLAKAGLIDASQRGVWTLTDAGRSARLDASAVQTLFRNVHRQFPRVAATAPDDANSKFEDEDQPKPKDEPVDHQARLLEILRSLPPAGFERICQRLLRESGFQNVVVTGRSGDGGLDGHGVLEVNPLVTFKVLFQCKRYKDGSSVTPSQVRDFRGAMQGRADKGLILTTSTFTGAAKQEATREGVPPIELVEGDKLVAMFERVELGLKPIRAFEVNESFFDEFRK